MNRDSAVPTPTTLRRCSDPRGFALIEAIVAAAVFAILVLGVLAGIDGAAGSAGREKARSVAGVLAEQDQERMRGMRALELSTHSWTRPVTVAGTKYTVASEAEWIRDTTGGTVSCTSDAKQADYLRIRSTVTSATVGTRTAPVKIDSLVAPPIGSLGANQGTLAVQVNDRDTVGVPGITVTITGPITKTAITNAVGCAIFPYIPVGAYDVKLDQSGYVNTAGVQEVHQSGSVTNGTTNVVTLLYDRAGAITATFDTRYYDAQANGFVVAPSRAFAFSLANAGTPLGYRLFTPAVTTPPTPANVIAATQLFPFKDPYGLYSGRCGEQNPTVANGGVAQIVDPGVFYNVVVRQPALRVLVTRGGIPWPNANVTATLVESSACPGDKLAGVRTDPVNGLTTLNSTDARKGFVTRVPVAGYPFDPGIPYGTYTLCVDDGSRFRSGVTVLNTAVNGAAITQTITIPTGGPGTSGVCPA